MPKRSTPNDLLRKARQERGWTQRRLAEEVGVEQQTVMSWENGVRTPSLLFRHSLCRVLDKGPEELGLSLSEKGKQAMLQQCVETDEAEQHPGTVSVRLCHHYREKNRQRMLYLVRSRWITGVLAHSLQDVSFIMPHFQAYPDALHNPWHGAIQATKLPARPLPANLSLLQAYDQAMGEILLLGEPGVGKTTLLLELTRCLLERAEQDDTHPLPVVFHLSYWTKQDQSLTAWLVAELSSKYQIPHTVGQDWIAADALLPLLDGLDEVPPSQRSACVEAINRYHATHHLVPLVVCSRQDEYLAQPQRLALQQAIVIQPPSLPQVDDTLTDASDVN